MIYSSDINTSDIRIIMETPQLAQNALPPLPGLPRDVMAALQLRIHSPDGPIRTKGAGFSVSQAANIDLTDMLDQSSSVLFSTIPSEIRSYIFEYAFIPDDDFTKPYPVDRFYSRPGHRYHPKTNLALLQTCKRVFQEARVLPVACATHTFWLFKGP
ncbi:uncharacterized protein BCR38DRAFT_420098 [Pseudomassariella vexata]|uniref:Uncharacterized protein n=1 Tax=Pseudomassariella vexata TaxID=1141098 RepID=A0A1Y2EG74_9PEZI|nr:uncharacterized protein BCR38DRAFT_420098 [Pseudomassariella vexata]ORY69795.1 hypothetical protein BCR38DRAFT_420098 [Pseudomassariella vexata]